MLAGLWSPPGGAALAELQHRLFSSFWRPGRDQFSHLAVEQGRDPETHRPAESHLGRSRQRLEGSLAADHTLPLPAFPTALPLNSSQDT